MVRHVRDEELLAKAIVDTRRGLRDVQRPTGTEKAQTMLRAEDAHGIAVDAQDRVGAVEDARDDEAAEAALVPKAPTGLTEVSNVGSFTEVGPVATVMVGFTPVTLSTDDEPVAVAEYELWDADGPLSRFPASPVVTQIPSDADRDLRVRACTVHGVWGDLSEVLAVTGALPSVVSRAPSDPVMTTSMGNAFAMWNGEYSAGGVGAHTVRVEARVGTTGAFTQQAVLTGPTNQLIRLGAVGDMVQVRFRAYDQLGRLTGTSATKSVVVEGVPFESFDDVARDRIIGTEDALAAVEAGQVVIGRTVDGLNRTFTSVESPGRGYLGHMNLAPSIKGSGVWAEVDRNRNRNPLFSEGVTGWSISAPANNLTFISGVGVRCDVSGTIGGSTQAFQQSASHYVPAVPGDRAVMEVKVSVPADAPRPIPLRPRLTIRDSGGVSATDWATGGATWFEPGETKTLTYERVVGAGLNNVQSSIMGDGSQPLAAGDTFVVHDGWTVQVNPVVEGGLIAPGVDFGDPDLRSRQLPSGETVLEGQLVSGWHASANTFAILSEYDDKPAIRMIGRVLNAISTDWGYAYAWIPEEARDHGTIIATRHLTEDYNGAEWKTRVRAEGPTFSTGGPFGTTTIRNEYTGLTGTYQMRLLAAEVEIGSDDIWWTDIGLYAGTLPDTAVPFHNGDLWHRLDYKNGELTVVEILVWDGQDWAPYGLWLDSLAVAGSVSADLLNATQIWADEAWLGVLRAGIIETDMVTPNFGDNLNLSGNAVNINLTERVDSAVSELASQADQIADAAAVAAAAATPADVQQEINTLAQGRVLTAEQALAVLSSKIDTYENSFSFEHDGLHIREAQTASAEMILAAAGMRLNADGATVAEINQGQMIIAQIITRGGRLGNHLVDSSIAGHTTWRLPSS